MKATQRVHDPGRILWLDNIARYLLRSGTLQRSIYQLSVTRLTLNPTIFNHAIKKSTAYDARGSHYPAMQAPPADCMEVHVA
jgi:transaldolase